MLTPALQYMIEDIWRSCWPFRKSQPGWVLTHPHDQTIAKTIPVRGVNNAAWIPAPREPPINTFNLWVNLLLWSNQDPVLWLFHIWINDLKLIQEMPFRLFIYKTQQMILNPYSIRKQNHVSWIILNLENEDATMMQFRPSGATVWEKSVLLSHSRMFPESPHCSHTLENYSSEGRNCSLKHTSSFTCYIIASPSLTEQVECQRNNIGGYVKSLMERPVGWSEPARDLN